MQMFVQSKIAFPHNSDYLIRDTISGGILQMQKLRMLSAGIQNWQRSPLLNLE